MEQKEQTRIGASTRRREQRKEMMIRTEDCFRRRSRNLGSSEDFFRWRRSKVAEEGEVDFHRRSRNRSLGSSEGNLTSLERV